jgi:mRNA interferase RelE/StbE
VAGWNPASSLRVLEESVAGTRGRRYRIEISPAARREIRRLARADFERVDSAIADLGVNQRPPGVVKLRGMRDVWRIREGQMRVIFRIVASSSLVVILRVVMRSERTYRGL